MNTVIDNLTSTSGWSAAGGASIYGTNSIKNFIAGNNSSSLMVRFNALNSYVEKTYSEDVTNYDVLTLWIYSRVHGDSRNIYIGDFKYKVDFGSGEEFYVQMQDTFTPMVFDISGINSISKIKITALHSDDDYLILSYVVASKDLFPLDIFNGIKEQLEYERDNFFTQKLVGTITGTTGDNEITFSSYPYYIDRYSVIEIDDGVNTEIHHLLAREGNTFQLSKLYDGDSLLNNYTNANVYLYYPVEFGMTQKEISLPSITIWGFTSEKEVVSSEFDLVYDTISVTNQNYQERQVGQYLNWEILIDCEDRESYEILGELSKIIRNLIGKKIIWVNGRKINIEPTAGPTELESTESYDIVPKIQYPITVQIKEEIYNRIAVEKTQTISVTVEIDGRTLDGE